MRTRKIPRSEPFQPLKKSDIHIGPRTNYYTLAIQYEAETPGSYSTKSADTTGLPLTHTLQALLNSRHEHMSEELA